MNRHELQLGQKIEEGIYLEDICRYVDDLRLVVTAKQELSNLTTSKVIDAVEKWMTKLLKPQTPSLEVAQEKTKGIEYGGTESRLIPYSARMNRVQSAMSGGFDAVGGLEILDTIQGLMREQQALNNDPNKSIWQFSPLPDVRNETALRFSASRFRTVYRSVRPLLQEFGVSSDDGEEAESIVTDRNQSELDEEARTFSLGLIERWVDDPSNVRLLRIGFDIWPDSKMLAEVTELMAPWVRRPLDRRKQQVVWYCLGELLRAGATETGVVGDGECLPRKSDLPQYQEILGKVAKELLTLGDAIPWYLRQQAWLYLATCDPHSCPKGLERSDPRLEHYHRVTQFLQGEFPRLNPAAFATFAILARRAFADRNEVIGLIRPVLTDSRKVEIALRDPDFIMELKEGDSEFFVGVPKYIKRGLGIVDMHAVDQMQNLVDVVLEPSLKESYRFRNELTLLRFANVFLKAIMEINASKAQIFHRPHVVTPSQIEVLLHDDDGVFDIARVKINTVPSTSGRFLYDILSGVAQATAGDSNLGFC